MVKGAFFFPSARKKDKLQGKQIVQKEYGPSLKQTGMWNGSDQFLFDSDKIILPRNITEVIKLEKW